MAHLKWTAAAVAGTALAGTLGTDVRSSWWERLEKPSFQPPDAAFGPAWTTIYSLIATASARTLDRTDREKERRSYRRALALNLGLNVAWTWIFFTGKKPRWALAEIVLLQASNLDLIRRSARVDQLSAALLVPYAGWTAFATALNAGIVRLNPEM